MSREPDKASAHLLIEDAWRRRCIAYEARDFLVSKWRILAAGAAKLIAYAEEKNKEASKIYNDGFSPLKSSSDAWFRGHSQMAPVDDIMEYIDALNKRILHLNLELYKNESDIIYNKALSRAYEMSEMGETIALSSAQIELRANQVWQKFLLRVPHAEVEKIEDYYCKMVFDDGSAKELTWQRPPALWGQVPQELESLNEAYKFPVFSREVVEAPESTPDVSLDAAWGKWSEAWAGQAELHSSYMRLFKLGMRAFDRAGDFNLSSNAATLKSTLVAVSISKKKDAPYSKDSLELKTEWFERRIEAAASLAAAKRTQADGHGQHFDAIAVRIKMLQSLKAAALAWTGALRQHEKQCGVPLLVRWEGARRCSLSTGESFDIKRNLDEGAEPEPPTPPGARG